ncbi:MAG: DUF58 domain-containing protein [Gemmataceae bacterium]
MNARQVPNPARFAVRVPASLWRSFTARWLNTRRARLPLLTGSHPRAVPGDWEGLDLAGIRPLQPGDSQRRLVARATARMNRPMVRVDLPAWRLPLMLVLDRSPGMRVEAPFGSAARVATELAKALVATATRMGDPVGVCLVTEKKHALTPPRTGSAESCRRLLEDAGAPRDLSPSTFGFLNHLPARLRQAAAYVVFTDGLNPHLPVALRTMARQHPVWLVLLESPLPATAMRMLPWESADGGLQGNPLDESAWNRLGQLYASHRHRCYEAVGGLGQPVTRLHLDRLETAALSSGCWILGHQRVGLE